MKKKLHSFTACLLAAALLLAPAAALATDLTYTTLPQDTDSDLVIAHKQAAASVTYRNITTATTTVVKSGSGIIDRIVINTAGSSATITIYDNTAASGTKIGTASANAQASLPYGCRFATGLTIVTVGTPDITVIYR